MIHKMGFDTQCSCCEKACMFDDVNDEGECAECAPKPRRVAIIGHVSGSTLGLAMAVLAARSAENKREK